MNEDEQNETQGKSSEPIINQQKTETDLLRLMTGYGQHASLSQEHATCVGLS